MARSSPAERKDWPLFKWLWRTYLRRHTPVMVVALILMSIEGSMMGALAYMLEPMFDQVFVAGDQNALWWVAFVIFAIFIIRATTGVGQKVLMASVAQKTIAHIQQDLLDHIMSLDNAFHQSSSPGNLISRVQNDVLGIANVWSALITGAGRDVVALISLFSVALWNDWVWTLIAMVGTPLLVIPALIAQAYVRRNSRTVQEVTAELSTRLDEVFHGITPVKLNRLEAYQSRLFSRLLGRRVSGQIKATFGAAMVPGMIDVATGVGFLAVLIYGGQQIIDGQKSIGEFMSFFTAMALAFEPLRRLGALSGLWQIAAAGIERISAIFETHPTIHSPATPVDAPAGPFEIALADVALSYGDTPVLSGAGFTARAGEITALVGPSGAGKSTIFNVVTRLVDPQSGRVSIAGQNVAEYDLAALRGLFSVVSQEALLFDETLRENILLGTSRSTAELQSALDAAHVSEFLPKLAAGLDTPVGPRGSNLSGGQRQRVAIARAILRDRPILLLDEATSALDVQSEALVQAALDRLSEGRTTLVIAHRLSTIRNADQIVVMDRGRVEATGTHDQLMKTSKTYAELIRLQSREETQQEGAADR